MIVFLKVSESLEGKEKGMKKGLWKIQTGSGRRLVVSGVGVGLKKNV